MTWLISFLLASSISTGLMPISIQIDDGPVPVSAARAVSDESEKTEATYPLNPDGRVSVGNINGTIKVEGWDRPEVRLVTNKVSNLRERLDDVEVEVSSTPGRFKVSVNYKNKHNYWKRGDRLDVNFSLMVPRTAFVDGLESVNGSINVSDLSNYTNVSAVNGGVRASNLKGKMKLSTVNGSVTATLGDVEETSDIFLSTVNGRAEVSLPSNVNATVKADSVNGSIKNGFGLPVKVGKYVGRDLYGKIGDGRIRVRLNSVNGSIEISRIEDGLEINPVENLLPQKSADDFDDSFDNDMRIAGEESLRVAELSARASVIAVDAAREAVGVLAVPSVDAVEVQKAVAEAMKEVEKLNLEEMKAQSKSIEKLEIDSRALQGEIARGLNAAFGSGSVPFLLEDTKTIKVVGKQTIEVVAPGCNVTVRGTDDDEIKYTVSRIARGRISPVKKIEFSQEENKSSVRLGVWLADGPVEGQVLDQVNVEVLVPKKSNLKINTDREIRLEGIDGELKLQGKYGPINVRDSSGDLDVFSKTGIVRVLGFDGNVGSSAESADVYLEGDFDRIKSYSKSGMVYLSLPSDGDATIRTNAIGLRDRALSGGKTLSIDGLVLEQISEGVWKLGAGNAAEFDFKFISGRLVLRPAGAVRADD